MIVGADRTQNTITIASRHPVRHVQIVLRIYKSISEILTGFDVDCSCVAYDGNQVYASPRAIVAYMTQTNSIDLTRRSPSYEMRLSKYAHRGFEIYWPLLDRSQIDPTIFERSFGRTESLARLLILEKLPKSRDREAYLDQRRAERGRPSVNRRLMRRRMIRGNIKNYYEDEIAEWVDEDASDYHTVSIPYGPKLHARKIEKLLYTKDLLLNSEWNKPKDREVNLHRHPVFFGTAEDVMGDCCGYCPKPATIEEEEVFEEESKVFVSGEIEFMKDDPGRQAIGSFNPITGTEWTAMAYVSNTAQFCQAIVDGDLDYVESWLAQEGNDPNIRDYTGRAPLHLAAANSTPDIVQVLIDHGARLIARLVDGKTALHLACMRGNIEIVSALLRKSEANGEEEEKKVEARRAARKAARKEADRPIREDDMPMQDAQGSGESLRGANDDSDVDMMDDAKDNDEMDATTESSMVNIRSLRIKSTNAHADDQNLIEGDNNNQDPDIYDVNVVAWDTAVSPLHLAIVQGHVDVVKCLVEDFGADVFLPIKLFNEDKSAKAAILTLVLALQLSNEKAEEMARTLIQLGASSAQASVDQTTALQYTVADSPDLLDAIADADATGVKRAINHFSVSGYSLGARVSSPLMTAIKAKDSLTALRLLAEGAKPDIDFAEYMRAYRTRYDPSIDSKQNRRIFQEKQKQPVIIAVQNELPLLAKNFVENGRVDSNTLTTEGYEVLRNEHVRRYKKGESLLDLVQKHLKKLRNWEYKNDEPHSPTTPKEDVTYLSRFDEGTYGLWSAQKQLNAEKQRYKRELKEYKEKLERSKDTTGVQEKQNAINAMMRDFEQLEIALVEHGAKRFNELYPEIKEPERREPSPYHHHQDGPKQFEIELKFQLGDLTEEAQTRYENLFEAAWTGDVKRVKTLTLTPWKDAKDEDQPPSMVAVRDQHGLSPFSIAVIQGLFELATIIMDVAQVQHGLPEESKRRRYVLDGGDESSNYSDDGEEVPLYSEIVDDDFTIESIGEVSLQVKSRVKPLAMLHWPCPAADFTKMSKTWKDDTGFSYFGPRKGASMTGKRTNTGSIKPVSPTTSSTKPNKEMKKPSNLLQLAIYNNDPELVTFLLGIGENYSKTEVQEDEESHKRTFAIPDQDFDYAIRAGHAHLVSEIIKRTCAGVHLTQLAEKYGAELKERPKYYQGLSVYGRKRKDWADAGRGAYRYESAEDHRPPLLAAAYEGSLELVEWFFSDAPMRLYNEFAENHKDDKRIQRLSLSKGGFDGAVEKFLSTRSHLAIHLAIMGEPTIESDKLLRYLIEACPDTIEAASVDGKKPLQVAFELYREDAAKLLIEAGADQTCRDTDGKNLLHSLLGRGFAEDEHLEKLKRMLGLIDKRLLPSMFLERSSGSLTPLHFWLVVVRHLSNERYAEVVGIILEYSGGRELSLINGGGDTPLHSAVKTKNSAVANVILENELELLNRENATGRTPFEMAEDSAIAEVCKEPPPMPDDHSFWARKEKKHGVIRHWSDNVLSRSTKDFAKDDKIGQRNEHEEVWKMLQDRKAKLDAEGIIKRRIVTLNEANEVARRLAAMKASTHRRWKRDDDFTDDEEETEQDSGDEVRRYMTSAKKALDGGLGILSS